MSDAASNRPGLAMNKSALAKMIDHTLLKPEATVADVDALVDQARLLGVLAVCVSPSMLPLDGAGLVVATVCGFPSGKHTSTVKAAEAAEAVGAGADELDMVIDVGAARARDWSAIEADISAVRAAVPAPLLLKVIIESAALDDDAVVATSEPQSRRGRTSSRHRPAFTRPAEPASMPFALWRRPSGGA